ncbi:MAG: YggT family protein [Anaerolineae bacterium]|nr:YggT family protein [Anaerolineae bacterium]
MAQEKIEVVRVAPHDGYQRRVVEYRLSTRDAIVLRVNQIIWLLAGIVCLLLLVRVIFVAINANPSSDFVAWLYALTNNFVAPFAGITGNLTLGSIVIDVPALIAMALYTIAAAVITYVIRILLGSTGGMRSVTEVERLD